MDNSIVPPSVRETVVGILAVLLVLAAFVFAGTVDHDEEVRHEQAMAQLEEEGAWVLR